MGKVLVIWDGLPAHRSRLVKDFDRAHEDRPVVERLPGYTPELNPVEHLWGYWKHHALPNLCPENLGALSSNALQALRRIRQRPRLVVAFWKQAELFDVTLFSRTQ